MTGTERLHGPPLKAAHKLHQQDESRNATELLDRHRHLAAGRKSVVGQGQTQRRALGHPRRRSKISRAARRARHSRRRQSHGKNLCTALASVRVGDLLASTMPISQNTSASGDWRWQAKRAAKTLADGSTPRSAEFAPEVHQPRAHLQRRHGGRGAARIHADAPLGNGRTPPARGEPLREHVQLKLALQRFHHHHPRPHLACAHSARIPKSSARSERYSERIGGRARRYVCWACRLLRLARTPAKRTLLEDGQRKRWQQAHGPPPTACATSSEKKA